MQEKGMPKVCKMMPKGSQNGNQNPLKMQKIPEKTVSENLCRNLMRKTNQNSSTTALFHRFWIDF